MSEMTGRFVSAAGTQVQAPTDVHTDAPSHVVLEPSDPNDTHPHKPQLVPGGPDNSLGRRDGEGTAHSGTAALSASGTVPQPSLGNELQHGMLVARTPDTSYRNVGGGACTLGECATRISTAGSHTSQQCIPLGHDGAFKLSYHPSLG
jgi:hypothetical protein